MGRAAARCRVCVPTDLEMSEHYVALRSCSGGADGWYTEPYYRFDIGFVEME